MVGVVWMVTGLILFPVLTAEVTSILTDTSYSLSLKKVRWRLHLLLSEFHFAAKIMP